MEKSIGIDNYLETVKRFYFQGKLDGASDRILERKATLAGLDKADASEARARLVYRYEQYRETIYDLSPDGVLSDDDRIELADIQRLLELSDEECRSLESMSAPSSLPHEAENRDSVQRLDDSKTVETPSAIAAPVAGFLSEIFNQKDTKSVAMAVQPAPIGQVVILQTPAWTVTAPAVVAHDWVVNGLSRAVTSTVGDFAAAWDKLPDLAQGIASLDDMVKATLKNGWGAVWAVAAKADTGITPSGMAASMSGAIDAGLAEFQALLLDMQSQIDKFNDDEAAQIDLKVDRASQTVSKGTEIVAGILSSSNPIIKGIGVAVASNIASDAATNVAKNAVIRRFQEERKKYLAEAGAKAVLIITRLLESMVAGISEQLTQAGFACDNVEGFAERHRLAVKKLDDFPDDEAGVREAALASLQIEAFSNTFAVQTLLRQSLAADDWNEHIPGWAAFFQMVVPIALDCSENGAGRAFIKEQLVKDFGTGAEETLIVDRIHAFEVLIEAAGGPKWTAEDWSSIVVPLMVSTLTAKLAGEVLPSSLIAKLSILTAAIDVGNARVIRVVPEPAVDQYAKHQVATLLRADAEPDLSREAKALSQLLLGRTARMGALVAAVASPVLEPIHAGQPAPGIVVCLTRLQRLAEIFGPDALLALNRVFTASIKKSTVWLTTFIPVMAQTRNGVEDGATLSALLLPPEKKEALLDEAAECAIKKRLETEAPYDGEWLSAMSELWAIDAHKHWAHGITVTLANRILDGVSDRETYTALREPLRGNMAEKDLDRDVYDLVLLALALNAGNGTDPHAIVNIADRILSINDHRRTKEYAIPILEDMQVLLMGKEIPGDLTYLDNQILKGILERFAKKSRHISLSSVVAYRKASSDDDDIILTPLGFATGKGRWHTYCQLGTIEARQGWTQIYIAYTAGAEKLEINNLPDMTVANWLAYFLNSMKSILMSLKRKGEISEFDEKEAIYSRLLMADWMRARAAIIIIKEGSSVNLSQDSRAVPFFS